MTHVIGFRVQIILDYTKFRKLFLGEYNLIRALHRLNYYHNNIIYYNTL